MKKSMLAFAAIALVACVGSVTFLSLSDVSSRNDGLNDDLIRLQKAYEELATNYYMLMGNYSALEYDYQNILLQNPYSLVPNPGSATSSDTQQMLSRYQALQILYMQLLNKYNGFVDSYKRLKENSDQRLMQGDLRSLVTPNDPEIVNLAYNITGKIGNASDPETDWKNIKALYDWVNTNIEYREDGLYPALPDNPTKTSELNLQMTDQMAQLPNETLSIRMGDCEDIANLLTSLIRAYYNNRFLVENIWITGENAGHVAVLIPFDGEKIVVMDPIRDYYSHDTLGNIWVNTISTEIYNWMNIWRPSLGNDVHVYRVYSDYMDRFFNGTEEYINWMYNR